MKQGLLQILRDIFSSSGYNVTESYRYDMVAEKNGYKTLIKFGAYPDYADIKNFTDQVTDGKGLYVTTHSMPDDLYQYATESGLIVWDRDDVALQIGKAVLADIEGTTADLELIPPVSQQARAILFLGCLDKARLQKKHLRRLNLYLHHNHNGAEVCLHNQNRFDHHQWKQIHLWS
jgi:hypothetical protein